MLTIHVDKLKTNTSEIGPDTGDGSRQNNIPRRKANILYD